MGSGIFRFLEGMFGHLADFPDEYFTLTTSRAKKDKVEVLKKKKEFKNEENTPVENLISYLAVITPFLGCVVITTWINHLLKDHPLWVKKLPFGSIDLIAVVTGMFSFVILLGVSLYAMLGLLILINFVKKSIKSLALRKK